MLDLLGQQFLHKSKRHLKRECWNRVRKARYILNVYKTCKTTALDWPQDNCMAHLWHKFKLHDPCMMSLSILLVEPCDSHSKVTGNILWMGRTPRPTITTTQGPRATVNEEFRKKKTQLWTENKTKHKHTLHQYNGKTTTPKTVFPSWTHPENHHQVLTLYKPPWKVEWSCCQVCFLQEGPERATNVLLYVISEGREQRLTHHTQSYRHHKKNP